MGRQGHRGGRKHNQRDADDDSESSGTPHQEISKQSKIMELPKSGGNHAAASQRASGPQWRNDLLHVWRKDTLTIVNMRNESETLPGIDAHMRQLERSTARKAPPPPPPPPATNEQRPVEPPRATNRSAPVVPPPENTSSAKTVQDFLNVQLNRMRSVESAQTTPGTVLHTNKAEVPATSPSTASATAIVEPRRASPQPPPTSLFHDPMWGAGTSWDAFGDDAGKKSAVPKVEAEPVTLDVLSGLLGDLRTATVSAPPVPQAAPPQPSPQHQPPMALTTAQASHPVAVHGPTPAAPAWSVSVGGTQTPQQQVLATMAAPHAIPQQMIPSVPVQVPVKQAVPQPQMYMANGVPYVLQPSFTGFQGVMGAPGMFFQQSVPGMQGMVQVPQGWTTAQPVKQTVVPANMVPTAQHLPMQTKPITMEEYQRMIQNHQMQAQYQQQQQVLQQHAQFQQQQQHALHQHHAGSFTVSGVDNGGMRNTNASANGVNIGAQPYTPKM